MLRQNALVDPQATHSIVLPSSSDTRAVKKDRTKSNGDYVAEAAFNRASAQHPACSAKRGAQPPRRCIRRRWTDTVFNHQTSFRLLPANAT